MDVSKIRNLIKSKKYQLAQEALLRMSVDGKSTDESQYLMGLVCQRQNNLEGAVYAYQQALARNPVHTNASIALSVIHNDIGHYKSAKKIFEQAEKNETKGGTHTRNNAVTKELFQKHLETGNLYRKIQRYDEATHEYIKAGRLDPNNPEANICLAKLLAQRGQVSAAKKELERLIYAFPNYISARIQLALLLYAMGNTVDARGELINALAIDPENKEAKKYLTLTAKATESLS